MKTKSIKYILLAILAFALLLPSPALSTIQWANNATSVVANAGGLAAGGTSLTVTAGQGDRFPAVATPHYFMVTLVDTSGNREIVKVTTRVALSNTMTIVRAQEGTSARDFPIGSLVELRVTKNALDYLSKSADIEANHYVADASALDQGATVNTRSIKSLVDAIGTQQATIEIPHTGTGTTTTYTVSTGFTIPVTISLRVSKGALISVAGGQTLTMDGIVQAGAYQVFTGAGTATVSTYPQDQVWWGSAERFDAKVNLVQGSDADGDIYYRASGATTRLAKGTGLQQLRMNVGATAPEWATPTAVESGNAQEFRLTLTSGVPVTTGDVINATTIYCTPYRGNKISLYDGANWNIRSSAEFSLALGTLTASLPYDVFVYDNAGTPTLEFLAWASATARATALAYQNGVLVKSGAATRRYLGTFYTSSTTQTADAAATRYLENYYNQVDRLLSGTYSTNRTTASATYVELNAEIEIKWVQGSIENPIFFSVSTTPEISVATDVASIAVAINSTSVATAGLEQGFYALSGYGVTCQIAGFVSTSLGYSYATVIGAVSGGGTLSLPAASELGKAKTYLRAAKKG